MAISGPGWEGIDVAWDWLQYDREFVHVAPLTDSGNRSASPKPRTPPDSPAGALPTLPPRGGAPTG